MSELYEWFKQRRRGHRSTIEVPVTLTKDQEVKVDAYYGEKKRTLDRRLAIRESFIRTFQREGQAKAEVSKASNVLRTLISATHAFNAVGDRYVAGRSSIRAFYELATALEQLQAEGGLGCPLVQVWGVGVDMCAENLYGRSFTKADTDIDRITVKATSGLEGLFPEGRPGETRLTGLSGKGKLPPLPVQLSDMSPEQMDAYMRRVDELTVTPKRKFRRVPKERRA